MKRYLRPAALAAALLGGTYGLLLIAAAAAPAPITNDQKSQSSAVADRLTADAALLAHPGLQQRAKPRSP